MSDERVKELMNRYKDAVEFEVVDPVDSALYYLLRSCGNDLPSFDNFHKAFRQYDVHDVSEINTAIWYLLKQSTLFWTTYGGLLRDEGGSDE